MKLLLENWRKFLSEGPTDYAYYGEKGRSPEELEADKDYKDLWRQKADHDFFNNEVTKIHWIGGYAGGGGCGRLDQFCVSTILKGWRGLTQKQKSELSVIGYLNKDLSNSNLTITGLVVDGWVSYAGKTDAKTEWTSTASPSIKKMTKSSGLPKRANVSHFGKNAMYGRDDFVDSTGRSMEEHNELIIDNWRVIGIVLATHSKYWKPLFQGEPKGKRQLKWYNIRKKEFDVIARDLEGMGLKLFNEKLEVIN